MAFSKKKGLAILIDFLPLFSFIHNSINIQWGKGIVTKDLYKYCRHCWICKRINKLLFASFWLSFLGVYCGMGECHFVIDFWILNFHWIKALQGFSRIQNHHQKITRKQWYPSDQAKEKLFLIPTLTNF